ncbi:MAG: hypothetical protein ACRESZ_19755 [Methylococcales bacterium]
MMPEGVGLDRTMGIAGTRTHDSIAIRDQYPYNFLDPGDVFEFILANVILMREMTEYARSLNFAYVMARAKASTLESTMGHRKPGL